MKDKLNTIKTAVCAVLAVGCAALAFLFWDASDRASSLLEENDTLRGQITALQREADTAAASAETMQHMSAVGPMVYVTPSGSKYHNEGCQYIGKHATKMPLSDAKEAGYTACAKCE